MLRKKRSKKRGPVRAKKVSYDGINFASGLEKYMYMVLQKNKVKAKYEGETFETKGRANESFPMRWKLFKQLIVSQFPGITLYKPQNQKDCDETIRIILEKRKS